MDQTTSAEAAIRWEVRPSTIHGMGMFAIAPIAEETNVLPIEWSPAELDEGDEGDASDYVIHTEQGPLYITNEARFINHGDEPNVALFADPASGFVVVALRDIEPGEELLADYEGNEEEADDDDESGSDE